MSPGARMEYVEAVYLRYKRASKKEKTIILNELCHNCGYHRKHAIRVLNHFKRFRKPQPKKRGKPSVYNKPSIMKPLKVIWLAADLPCSKRLKAIVPLWLPSYIEEYGNVPKAVTTALHSISAPSIDRLLKPIRVKYRGRGKATTKPGTLLRKHIPVKTEQWDETRPGFLEADTIAHCGDSMAGMFVFTVDCVDIATTWTEQRAVWGKGETGVLEQIKDVEEHIPFPLCGFDCDNGGEFLNYHLMKYLLKRKNPVQFTRSRPYHKDDNCHVEQKNWTHVRQWFGYNRFDKPELVPLMNDLYRNEWRQYHNFFLPSVKLLEKNRIASKIIKRYDKPKTPYQRVLESSDIPDSVRQSLKQQFAQMNPFALRKAIEKKLSRIFDLISSYQRT